MSTQVSARLDPAIFRLPVDRIRRATTPTRTSSTRRTLLEAEGHHPRVTMQVFQKQESVLGGIDEAIAVLKLCSGREEDGVWVSAWNELEVHALREGDQIVPRETVMTIEGDYSAVRASRDRLPRRRSPGARWSCATCSRSSRPPAASRSSTFRRVTTTGSSRPATAGAPTSPARSVSRPTPRRRGGAGAGSAPSRTG